MDLKNTITFLETLGKIDQSQPLLHIDRAILELRIGSKHLKLASEMELAGLLRDCCRCVSHVAHQWVLSCCEAKKIDPLTPVAAEEILAGPTAVMRYLHLMADSMEQRGRSGIPKLPGKIQPGVNRLSKVPVLPVSSLYDSLVFMGLTAETWVEPEDPASTNQDQLFLLSGRDDDESRKVCLVLGAGNVSSIPVTDALHMMTHHREAVLLKLNPVTSYLLPVLEEALKPLIERDYLRIINADMEVSDYCVHHSSVDAVHITGSRNSHDNIVWGTDEERRQHRLESNSPYLKKSISSELGNVSPWIIVPGKYTKSQLRAQAEHLAASIVNNASFNCVATKMIVTSRQWPQRSQFLDLLANVLSNIPKRYAYYPGAHERFDKYIALTDHHLHPENETLPWTLLRDVNQEEHALLFEEESFVCICAETSINEGDPQQFLNQAIDLVNEQLFGTLSASITLSNSFHKRHAPFLEQAIARLNYGTVCLNSWAGVAYGLMTPPWGGAPGATIHDTQSGIGFVHNTFFLKNVQKTVMSAPLKLFPKPAWFATHRTAHRVAWNLKSFYESKAPYRLIPLSLNAVMG